MIITTTTLMIIITTVKLIAIAIGIAMAIIIPSPQGIVVGCVVVACCHHLYHQHNGLRLWWCLCALCRCCCVRCWRCRVRCCCHCNVCCMRCRRVWCGVVVVAVGLGCAVSGCWVLCCVRLLRAGEDHDANNAYDNKND